MTELRVSLLAHPEGRACVGTGEMSEMLRHHRRVQGGKFVKFVLGLRGRIMIAVTQGGKLWWKAAMLEPSVFHFEPSQVYFLVVWSTSLMSIDGLYAKLKVCRMASNQIGG